MNNSEISDLAEIEMNDEVFEEGKHSYNSNIAL
jgi:hypothetical protein